MLFYNKRFELTELSRIANVWRLKNDRIIFTNGCFDILHAGHAEYLHHAKALGHRLIVGVNSDSSVRAQGKGPNRPVNHEEARMSLLAALHSVDAVILFNEATPLSLITALQPDFLVKGADYDPSQTDPSARDYIVGSAEVRSYGGEVITIPLLEGFSTTAVINKLAS